MTSLRFVIPLLKFMLEHDPRFRGGRPFPKTGTHPRNKSGGKLFRDHAPVAPWAQRPPFLRGLLCEWQPQPQPHECTFPFQYGCSLLGYIRHPRTNRGPSLSLFFRSCTASLMCSASSRFCAWALRSTAWLSVLTPGSPRRPLPLWVCSALACSSLTVRAGPIFGMI